MALTVNLIGPSPWGFRIYGGRDFKRAITISKVNGGSKANQADLQPGDIILEINGENTGDMLNVQAQNKIKNSKTQLQLVVKRNFLHGCTLLGCPMSMSENFSQLTSCLLPGNNAIPPGSPRTRSDHPSPGQTNGINTLEQLTGRFQEAVFVSPDENQNYRDYTISSPVSLSPGPYSPDPPSSPDGKRETLISNKGIQLRSWSPEERNRRLSRPLSQEYYSSDYRNNSVSSRTPTPPGCSSPHSPVDRDVPMSPRRSSSSSDFNMRRFDRESEVYKMIQENRESCSTPRQSNTFKKLQHVLEADEKEAALRFPGKLSPNAPKPATSVGGVKKTHICEKCGTSIVTVAVRITDDLYRHSECYTCTDCGLNLMMRGHFWFGDVMYCEKHAKERHQGQVSSPHATMSPR